NYFRPVGRELYFYAVSRIAGHEPLAYRVVNLGILAAIIAMVVALARRLSGPRAAIFAGAAFTLFYPASVLMGWVSCSQDLLATAFGLVAALLWLRQRTVWAAVAYFLALFSKESVAPLPLVLAAWQAWGEGAKGGAWKDALRRTLPLWIAAAVW